MESSFYKHIIHEAPFGFAHHEIILDDAGKPCDYRFIEVNEAFEKLTGLKKENLTGFTVREAIPGIENSEFDWIRFYGKIALEGGAEEFEQYSEPLSRMYKVNAYSIGKMFFTTIFTDITGHRQTEQLLQSSKAQQQAYMDNAPFGVMIADKNGKYLEVNDEACRITGYSSGELKSMNIIDITDAESQAEAKKHFQQLTNNGRAFGELAFITKTGDKRWWNVVAIKLSHDRFLGFHEDITARKLAEAALVQSRSELKAIYDFSPVMMCLVDTNRRVIFANAAFTSLTGTDEILLQGGHACGVFGCINAADDVRGCGFGANCRNCSLRIAMEDTLENGTGHSNVEFHTTLLQNGETRMVSLLGSTALIESNNQRNLLLCLIDITERKKAEELLRKSQKNLNDAQHLAQLGSWEWDMISNKLTFSDEFYRIFGLNTQAPVINTDLLIDFIHPDDKEFYLSNLENAMTNGVSEAFEYRIVRSDGEVRNLSASGNVIFDENHKPVKGTGVVQDITERRQAQTALLESESRFKQLFLNNPQSVQLVDSNGFTLLVNEAHTRLFGPVPPPDYSVFDDPLFRKQGLSGLWENVRNGEIVNFPDFRYNTSDRDPALPDNPVWLQMTAFPLSGSNKSQTGFVLMHTEITGRKQAEDALRQSEDRLQIQNNALLALISNGALFHSNLQKAVAEITEASSVLVGTERVSVWIYSDDYAEMRCIDIYHQSLAKHTNNREILRCEEFPAYFACQKRGEVIAATDVFTDPRTSELPAAYYKKHNIRSMLDTPVWFHNRLGAVLCFEHTGEQRVWSAEDVRLAANMAALLSLCFQNEERKQAEGQLKASEEQFSLLIELAPDAFLHGDKNGNLIGVNNKAVEMFGFSKEELLKMNVQDLFQSEVLEAKPLRYDLLNTGITLKSERQLRKRNDENVFIEMNSKAMPDGTYQTFIRDITERRQAEVQLKASEKKYHELSTFLRLLADNMPDMLWAKNLNKEFIFTNKAICSNLLNAADTQEPLGKTDMFFANRERNSKPDDSQWHTFGEICRDSDSITLDEMKPMQFDEFGNVKGKFLYLDVHKAPLFDDSGQLIGVVGSARDVTEAKEAENQLRKLSQAVEQSPASVVITDLDGNIEYVNPKFTEVTGYTLEEAIGQTPRILKSGENPPEFYKHLWKTILAGNTWHGEFHNKKKNGDLFWETASISPIMNDEGKISHYIAVKEDITERKTLEEDLKHQSQLRELLMEISSGFINIPLENVEIAIQISLEKLGTFVNADRSYVFEYNWIDEVANNTYEWVAADISPQIGNMQNLPLSVIREMADVHINGEVFLIPDVYAYPNSAGRRLIEKQGVLSFLAVPMMKLDKCIGFVGFDSVNEKRDYSPAEIQLLKVFAQMLVNIILRKEMVAQLVISKEKAEESNRLKSHFLNNISHEIRTPMNGLLGFGKFMMQENLSKSEKIAHFEILRQSGERLMKTVDDIIDISKLKSGSVKSKIKHVQTGELMKQLANKTRSLCANANILVILDIPDQYENLVLHTDEVLLTKILSQLTDNAIKFTEAGRITLGYDVKGRWIEFYVKDTGKGIASNKLDTVFEPFMQEDISNTRGHEGSGLGLSIARGMVHLLGGSMWVESIKGEGSVFFFTLPLAPGTGNPSRESDKALKTSKPGAQLVLIAEDNKLNYTFMKAVVQKSGFSTLHAWNGAEAVELCHQYPEISLIFMDIKMPVMDGLEATAKIKSFRPDIHIVAITALAQTGDNYAALEAGCDEYLAKPVDAEELIDALKRLKR